MDKQELRIEILDFIEKLKSKCSQEDYEYNGECFTIYSFSNNTIKGLLKDYEVTCAIYKYGVIDEFQLQGFPKDNYLGHTNDYLGAYYSILMYSRELSKEECEKHGLDFLGVENG